MATQPSSPLADSRLASGYTQESFAERLGVDRSTIGRWERGVQSPQPWQRPDLAKALDITLEHLDDLLRRTRQVAGPATATERTVPEAFDTPIPQQSHRNGVPFAPEDSRDLSVVGVLGDDVVHAAIPRLRRALDSLDLPEDGATRSIVDLGHDVAQMIEHRVQARYIQLAFRLPNLISELARVIHSSRGHCRRHAAALMTLALRAADGVAYKYGYHDLSARVIDLMRASAETAEGPLLRAAVAYVRTETFFATGDLTTAARRLVRAADQLADSHPEPCPASAAAFGALHMRVAVVAGRAGDSDAAWAHLDDARRAARHVPDGVYLGTAFGPSSVRIHELAVATELGDCPAAIQRAATWHPPSALPAERRSHYYIDLARAQLDLGHHEDAYQYLETARRIAPQHTREHPQVRRTLSTLLRTHRSPNDDLLRLAGWARAR